MFSSTFNMHKEKIQVAGVVERFGAFYGNGESAGFSILLQDGAVDYRILNEARPDEFPIGLTQPGDEVVFLADVDGAVCRRDFRNLTLEARLSR